jgi:hypothetical protein
VSPEQTEAKSGLSLQTLLISSLSAVAAAVVVPMFWERGSLIATAVTPIVVALASEALNRPAKAITAAAPKVTRRSATGAAVRARQPTGVGARGEGPERVSRWGTEDDPFGLRGEQERRPGKRWVKLAVATGLLAAVIGIAVVTFSELAIFGHSIGHSDRATSVFGGSERPEKATPTPTPSAEGTATPGATGTASPAPSETATATETPSATTTPEATATQTPFSGEATPEPTP